MNKFKTDLLFPQLVSQAKNVFKPEPFLSWVDDFKKINPKERVLSNESGYQYPVDLSDRNLLTLLGPVFKSIEEFFSTFFVLKPGISVYFSDGWLNINPPNSFNWEHEHPNAFYSCVVYLKTPKNCGQISFRSSCYQYSSFLDEATKNKLGIHGSYFYSPNAGDVLLFPGTLLHRVYPNKSKEDRISIAFNLTIETTIQTN